MSIDNRRVSLKAIVRIWWFNNRVTYNEGSIIAGFTAFLLYNILRPHIIAPYEEFDETGLLMIAHGVFYLLMMLVANVFYSLGWLIDSSFNKNDSLLFREGYLPVAIGSLSCYQTYLF